MVELNGWIRNTVSLGQRELWRLAYEEFRNGGFDEDMVRFLDMDLDLVTRYGPADVSLMEIARQHVARRPVILTVDSHLFGECWRCQITSELLDSVCASSA